MIESALIDAQVKRLDFALALHAERLGFQEGEPILSSPPSDQKSLAESAQAARDGQLDQAIQILKSAMPSTKVSASTPLRRRLFQVRLSSLERLRAKRSGKKERAKTLDQLFLEEGDAYLLASEELAQAFAFYLKALRGAIKKAQYPIVARCLSYAELLSPQDAQVLSYRQRLTSKATEWLQMAKEHQRNGQLKEARLLVSTAILFLRDELKTEAMMLKASLP